MTKILRQCLARNLGDRSRHFHAGRPAADDDEVHCRRSRRRVLRFLGKFEGHQDASPDLNGVLEALQTGRELFPFGVAEIGMARPSRDDEVIIMNFALPRPHNVRPDVDLVHFREDHFDIFIFSKDPAHRRGNIRRRKRSGCDLVKERLKEVIIRPIDHRYPDRLIPEVLRGLQATKARADNHDARCAGLCGFHRQMIAVLPGGKQKIGCQFRRTCVSSAPYAQVHRAQQDEKSRRQAVQNYRDGKSAALPRHAPASHGDEERQAQEASGKIWGSCTRPTCSGSRRTCLSPKESRTAGAGKLSGEKLDAIGPFSLERATR